MAYMGMGEAAVAERKRESLCLFLDRHTAATPDGAGHGTDVPYAFQTLTGAPAKEDAALSDMISSYLVNFAGTGDPNGEGLPEWPSFSESDQKVMFFDEQPSVRPIPNLDKLKALDGYYSWRRERRRKPAHEPGGRYAEIPPSMTIVAPVMKEDASEQSHKAACAISSG